MSGKRYIPPNYHNGANLFGYSYPYSHVLQAFGFGLTVFLSVWRICRLCHIPAEISITVTLVFTVPVFLLALNGIGGGTLLMYVREFIRFRTHRSCYYYNPRVKHELQPYDMQTERELLPREVLQEKYSRFRDGIEKRAQADALQLTETDRIRENANLYFDDDADVLEKPVEYMNRSEYRNLIRQKRKEEKEKLRKIRKEKRDAERKRKREKKEEKRRKKT